MATDGEGNAKASAVPPYLAYQTFQNFLNSLRLKGGVPGRIDRSVLHQFSGAVQGQLMAALRYLGLVSTDGLPTSDLDNLVKLEGVEWEASWSFIMKRSYGFIFDDESFPLATATTRQLEEKFTHVAGGDTVRKCLSFFLLAAKDAGFQMSPYIKAVKARRGTGGKRRPATSGNGNGTVEHAAQVAEPRVHEPAAQSWSQMLLSKFPSFDPQWPDEVEAKWFDAFDKLMKQGQ